MKRIKVISSIPFEVFSKENNNLKILMSIQRNNKNTIKLILFWNDTVLRQAVITFDFWMVIVLYGLIRWYMILYNLTAFSSIGVVSAIATFINFLLVFFNSKVNERANMFNDNASELKGRVFEISLLAGSSLSEANALRLFRYINVAHALVYMGASPNIYGYENLLKPLNQAYQLLDTEELQRLELIGFEGQYAIGEVLVWMITLIKQEQSSQKINESVAGVFLNQFLQFRKSYGGIFKLEEGPIPFIYLQFLYISTVIYLPLFSICSAISFPGSLLWYHEFLITTVVILNAFFIIGIRHVAQVLEEPLGTDDEDFPVKVFVESAIQKSWIVLQARQIPSVDQAYELQLAEKRLLLGEAFKFYPKQSYARMTV